jgi:hypothetical protein
MMYHRSYVLVCTTVVAAARPASPNLSAHRSRAFSVTLDIIKYRLAFNVEV